MKTNRTAFSILLLCSISLTACSDNRNTSTNIAMPEFARQINAQKGVDYGGVFAVITINGDQQRFEFADNTTKSIEVTGIVKDANNDIRVEWWETFKGSNLALSHQEGTLYIASSDTSSTIPFDYNIESYDNDMDGKSNLAERQNGTCPVPQPCAIVPPVMVNIAAGQFQMGAIGPGFAENEYPQHTVSVEAFSLAEAEITWADWDVCVDANACTVVEENARFADITDLRSHPVGGVSYNQVMDYIGWVNVGLGGGFRLPTEAEFEYALRGGTTTAHYYGDDSVNYCEFLNGFNGTDDCDDGFQWSSPVKTFPPNPFGLYDINGNIDEWTADCWHDNYINAPANAEAWRAEDNGDCNFRAMRGSNYYFDVKIYRSSSRRKKSTRSEFAEFMDGFRLARD